jgi:hypothetical protein
MCICACLEILFSHKKYRIKSMESSATCHNIDLTEGYYVKKNKQSTERQAYMVSLRCRT